MDKPEHILRQEGAVKRPRDCTCDDGYWMRDLVDPGCHYHGAYAEGLRELITELAEAVQYCHVYRINDATIEYHRELMQRAREETGGR